MSGYSITPFEAFNMFNITRLSARTHRLREWGYPVVTKLITSNKKTYASYSITDIAGARKVAEYRKALKKRP